MNNRFIRLAVYFVIGIVIGASVGFLHKHKKIDEGVVELTPDEVREENIKIPGRIENTAKNIEEGQSLEKAKMEVEKETADSNAIILTPMPE